MTKLHSLVACCLLPALLISQTEIGGTINDYSEVTAIDTCAAQLQVTDPGPFDPGTDILIIQMKGALLSIDESSSFGDILDIRSAGRYERARIASVTGSTLTLENKILNEYNLNGRVQIVSLPRFADAVVTAPLTAQPWNGSTGGVLALEVSGTLRLEAEIDVSGLGFAGGLSDVEQDTECQPIFNNNTRDYGVSTNTWRGAHKGEGIGITVNKTNARGPQATGGGGGNDHNSGGGGGANVTLGGQGGENRQPGFGCKGYYPGLGGKPAPAEATRVYLGGGGGGGHENNGAGANGGNGGGMVFLLAGTIEGNDQAILAHGETPPIASDDGTGGGGAGGTIVLNATQINGNLMVAARGGDGGTINNKNQDRCFGPGGGGSGGRLITDVATALTIDLNGGAAGLSTNSASCPDSPNGGRPGTDGVVETFAGIPESTTSNGMPAITQQPAPVIACPGTDALLTATTNGAGTPQWQIDRGAGFADLSDDATYQGAQTDQLTISEIDPAQNGDRFRLVLKSDCFPDVTSDAITLSLGDPPNAAFQVTGSSPTFSFDNQSTDADSFSWEFGDGQSSAAENPSHTYSTGGNYVVRLIALSSCGVDTVTQSIEVLGPPTASFNTSPRTGCTPLEVSFNNKTQGDSLSFSWKFPGGKPASSTEANPTVLYAAAGTYDVVLIATNPAGADTLRRQEYISTSNPATADFEVQVVEKSVQFTNNSQFADSSQWEFGDGQTSSDVDPAHTYAEGGNYTVSLIAANGCSADTIALTISVLGKPIVQFNASPRTGCTPLEVSFNNKTQGDSLSFSWKFPGGTPASSTEANPTVLYAAAGTYDVVLIATNPAGADTLRRQEYISTSNPATADFEVEVVEKSVQFTNNSQFADSYRWEFGDGQTSTDKDPDYTYQEDGVFTIILEVANSCSEDRLEKNINVTSLPIAGFSAGTTKGCRPMEVSFTNSSSPSATGFAWRFPGCTPAVSSEAVPVVTYDSPGVYDVELIATNAKGSDTVRRKAYIVVEEAPDAGFVANANGLDVQFSSAFSGADTYQWSFGDGASDSSPNPLHRYGEPGQYDVIFTIGNACGSDTSRQRIMAGQRPAADFSFDDGNGCLPHVVRFTDKSTGTYDRLSWSFPGGEPSVSTEANPQVTYNQPGNFDVTLTISGPLGESTATFVGAIKVRAFPVPAFDLEILGGGEVRFNNLSSGAERFLWDFGDGNKSDDPNPTHVFEKAGVYEITLNAQNGSCASASNRTIGVILTSRPAPDLPGSLRLFPNPVKGWLYLQSENSGLWPLQYRLFHASGQEVLSGRLTGNASLSLHHLPAGTYLLQLQGDKGNWLAKVVVVGKD